MLELLPPGRIPPGAQGLDNVKDVAVPYGVVRRDITACPARRQAQLDPMGPWTVGTTSSSREWTREASHTSVWGYVNVNLRKWEWEWEWFLTGMLLGVLGVEGQVRRGGATWAGVGLAQWGSWQ